MQSGWAASIDLTSLERQLGVTCTYDPTKDECEMTIPRSDLSVTAAGVKLTSALGLHSSLTFQRKGSHVYVEGYVALLESEVNPIVSVALDNGLHINSLHDHFVLDSPSIMFLHFHAEDYSMKVIDAVSAIFKQLKAIKSTAPSSQISKKSVFPTINPNESTLNPDQLNAVFKVKGVMNQGVYKVIFNHVVPHRMIMRHMSMAHAISSNSWTVFVGSPNDAVMIAEFSVLESELQSVLKLFRQKNINVTAIHQHSLHSRPRVVIVHCNARGNALALAEAVQKTLVLANGVPHGRRY